MRIVLHKSLPLPWIFVFGFHPSSIIQYLCSIILVLQDFPKLHRCTELLSMNEELKQARKAFDVSEENLANATD